MIIPIKYLWEQLDGPQVTAFTTAIFEYMKSIFDDKLEYFNNISIKTANNQHLTLLGLLSGLVRPTVSEADKNYFYFSEASEHPVEHGFSALTNRSRGGRFVGIGVGQGTHNVSLNEAHYRALLEAWLESDGELGSLELLDTICYKLSQLDLGDDVTPFYTFEFMSGDNVPAGRAPGDVFIDMGTMSQWNNPLHVYQYFVALLILYMLHNLKSSYLLVLKIWSLLLRHLLSLRTTLQKQKLYSPHLLWEPQYTIQQMVLYLLQPVLCIQLLFLYQRRQVHGSLELWQQHLDMVTL